MAEKEVVMATDIRPTKPKRRPKEDPTAKALRVKSGMVKRLVKEHSYYVQEEETERKKLDAMRADGADASDVKMQAAVHGESAAMIPNVLNNLRNAVDGLDGAVADAEGSDAVEAAKVDEAKAILADARAVLGGGGAGEEEGKEAEEDEEEEDEL